MSGDVCDVCGGETVAVVSSTLGAISYAICDDCAIAGAEPWSILIGGLLSIGRANVAEWTQATIDATCARLGRTADELWAAVERTEREYERYCEEEQRAIAAGEHVLIPLPIDAD